MFKENLCYNTAAMFFYLIKGGPLMIAIGLCSIAAGALAIVQIFRLRQASQKNTKPIGELAQFVQKRNWMRAAELCEQYDHPFLNAWTAGFRLLADGKSDLRDIEETVEIEGAKVMAQIESALKPLGAITVVLPMLGFLGTIFGLIVSFQNWEQMGAHVSISALAGGIYQAMITTAAGLITAIPYHLLYHYFTARVHGIALDLSKETTQLFRWIKEALLREPAMESAATLSPAAATTTS